jgi:hypothetical protein
MQLSTESARASSALEDRCLDFEPLRISDPFEIGISREFRLRGLAWGLTLSAILWSSFLVAGRELWSLWR